MSVPLSIKQRSLIGSNACKRVRQSGDVPGVLYGEKKESLHIQFSNEDFVTYQRQKDRILALQMDGKEQEAIVQKVQYDSFGDEVVHVDFLRISSDKEITVPVELDFKGTPKGIQFGGATNIRLKKVNVTCLPSDIPKSITVDISGLDISEQLRVKDLGSSDKYKVANHSETMLVIVRPPRKAKGKTAAEGEEEK
ncbi:50S ribosomal protein L25 [Candidatus Uabimicrobium amorphum]|uniref:Large ribosomal subunit protein bL25 n=1 Tax=Uabimicrobium amorphum TaxID=2596890 RepID=A0A5S9IHN1_UABAM|nr:50S ribosomal protein L25 [Candidatus Uabimicrobium amorphum]BBM81834.1 50S ribosomal protein L25 [Candidatus Uabimicrobium amorphum]